MEQGIKGLGQKCSLGFGLREGKLEKGQPGKRQIGSVQENEVTKL